MLATCVLHEASAFEIRHPDATGRYTWDAIVAE
jgi:hypothetical protein